jgi:ribosome modulation factor
LIKNVRRNLERLESKAADRHNDEGKPFSPCPAFFYGRPRMSDYEAFETGYDAYWDGMDVSDNPYDQAKEALAFRSWIEGWREARKHDYDESDAHR